MGSLPKKKKGFLGLKLDITKIKDAITDTSKSAPMINF
jgi:hypothetical protein